MIIYNDRSLEDILASGLDEVQVPEVVESTTSDDVNEAIVACTEAYYTFESALLMVRFKKEHLEYVRAHATESDSSYIRSMEADAKEGFGDVLKKAFERVWEAFKAFTMRIVNFFRTINLKDKMKAIDNAGSKLTTKEVSDALLDKYGKRTFGNTKYIAAIEYLFKENFEKGLLHALNGGIKVSTNAFDAITEWKKNNLDKLKAKDLNAVEALDMYLAEHGTKCYSFFQYDFQQMLHKHAGLTSSLFSSDNTTNGDERREIVAAIRDMFSLCNIAYYEWINLSKMAYKACSLIGGKDAGNVSSEKTKTNTGSPLRTADKNDGSETVNGQWESA